MLDTYNKLAALTRISEKPIGDIMRKQQSIYRLFPQFDDRVDQVASNGGVRLVDEGPDTWSFTIASGTTKGKSYKATLHFADLDRQILEKAKNPAVRTKDGLRVDFNKLAAAIIDDVDVQIDHTDCPAYNWWGQKYINTQRATAYRDPQNIRPKVRNPKEYGSLCKHLQLLFEQLPFYTSTFAKMLKRYHAEAAAEVDRGAKAVQAGIGKAADFLGARQGGGSTGGTTANIPTLPEPPETGTETPAPSAGNDVKTGATDKKISPETGAKSGIKGGVQDGVKKATESICEKIEYVEFKDLLPCPFNRELDKSKVDKIKKEVEETGKVKPFVVTEVNTDDGVELMIIDGHHRYQALKDLDWVNKVPVVMADHRGIDTANKNKPEEIKK